MLTMLNVFSGAYLPYVYLFLVIIWSYILPFLILGSFLIEFEELFICFRYKSFIRYVIYKYFHSVACPFILLTVSLKKEVLNLSESSILN